MLSSLVELDLYSDVHRQQCSVFHKYLADLNGCFGGNRECNVDEKWRRRLETLWFRMEGNQFQEGD